jgi:hypothetical protein
MVNEEIRDMLTLQAVMFTEQEPSIRFSDSKDIPEGVVENFALVALFAIVKSNKELIQNLSGADFFDTFVSAHDLAIKEIKAGNWID